MSHEHDDDFEAIRAAAARLGLPSTSAPVDDLESADDFIARMKSSHGPIGSSDPSRWRRTVTWGIAAAAAAAATVAVIVIPGSKSPVTADSPPVLDYSLADGAAVATAKGEPAREELLNLAAVARRAQADEATRGTQEVVTSAWYAQVEHGADKTTTRFIPTEQVSRVAPDGSVVIEQARGAALTPEGRVVGAISDPETREEYPPGDIDPNRAQELGTDPAAVRASLLRNRSCEQATGAAATECLYGEIIALHDQWVVSPDLRAALWTMLAEETSVRSLGAVEDRAGRPGVGFAIDSDGALPKRIILIISEDDGRLLGTEQVLRKDDPETGTKAGDVFSFTAILKSRWVG